MKIFFNNFYYGYGYYTITTNKTLKLLKELEDLDLLRILDKNYKNNNNLSDKYAGKLPKKNAKELQNNISQSRNQWNRDI